MKRSKEYLAHQIRNSLEYYAEDNGYSDTLAGLCALGACSLHMAFLREGYSSKVIWGFSLRHGTHYFVESDGYIWDVTATQFDFARNTKIYTCRVSEADVYKDWYKEYRPKHVANWCGITSDKRINQSSPIKVRNGFNFWFQGWLEEERPSTRNIRTILTGIF